jgi:vitamin B12 transporter
MKKYQLLAAFLCALSPSAFAANDTLPNEGSGATFQIEQAQQSTSAPGTTNTMEDEIKKSSVSVMPTTLPGAGKVENSQYEEATQVSKFKTTLDEVVVTATRIQQPLKKTLSSTSVITQEDIKNSQAPDVITILRTVAGVEFSQNGGMGKSSSLFLRGANSTQVLVLVDGVRINSATTGTASIQDILLDQVERIEVVRGNVSSIYGSDAIGGVVQIFTKNGQGKPRFNAAIGVGNLGTQRVSAGFGGANESTNYHLQATSFNTDGVSAINTSIYPKANPDTDGYRNTSVSANLRHSLSTGNSISFSAYNSMGFNQYDNAFGVPSDINTNTQKINKVSLAVDNTLSEKWLSHLQYALGVDEGHDYKNGKPTTYSLFKTSNQQLNWQNTLQLSSTGKLLLGAENLLQNVDSDVAYTINQRAINSLYAGYTGNYGAHLVQANLRSDNNSQYGTENTGLLGYGYTLNENWRISTSYSTAFRAPTFNELYYPGFGNTSISPEHSNNAEAGLHYVNSARQIDVVYFNNLTHDLIVYSPGPVNISQARIDGVELSYIEQFGDSTLKTSVTSQNPRDENTGTPLVRRANLHGSVAWSQKIGVLQWGAEWIHSGERDDSYTDPNTFAAIRTVLPSYDTFNLSASWALNKETTLAFRADNLTDQNDATVYGFNPLGRILFVNMRYQQ